MSNQQSAISNQQSAISNQQYPSDYIPYHIRVHITQIDPKLDIFWQQHLHHIFKNISPKDRKNVAEQILAPNNIFWNSEKKAFEHREAINLSFGKICAAIPPQYKKLKALTNKILASMSYFEGYTHALEIADYLENILNQISAFDTEDNIELLILKQNLYRSFIYTAAAAIRHKPELILPENIRQLSSDAVKVFINEVYLKQQILGYWFKTLRNRQLEEIPSPLISEYLVRQKKERQLEIIRASGYLFIIAPMVEYNANPFTIRRFLLEDNLFGRALLLNGIALPTAHIDNPPPHIQEAFKRQIESIITISGNVRSAIVDFMEQLNNYHEDYLLPLLFKPFDVSASGLEQDVQRRLRQFEQQLSTGILQPMAEALRQLPNNKEEFDYMYITLRQLFGSIISAFKDFQAQPALLMSLEADMLLGRLVAYAALLEKRRDCVFVEQDELQWNENHKKTKCFINYARSVAKEFLDDYLTHKNAVSQHETMLAKPATFMGRLFKTKEKLEDKLDDLKKSMRKVQYAAHAQLYFLPDDIKTQTLHMELETSLILNEKTRYYAFPNGANGISALPLMFPIADNRIQFNLPSFAKQAGFHSKLLEEELASNKVEQILLKRI